MSFTDKKQVNCEITKIKEEVLEYLSVQGLFLWDKSDEIDNEFCETTA